MVPSADRAHAGGPRHAAGTPEREIQRIREVLAGLGERVGVIPGIWVGLGGGGVGVGASRQALSQRSGEVLAGLQEMEDIQLRIDNELICQLDDIDTEGRMSVKAARKEALAQAVSILDAIHAACKAQLSQSLNPRFHTLKRNTKK